MVLGSLANEHGLVRYYSLFQGSLALERSCVRFYLLVELTYLCDEASCGFVELVLRFDIHARSCPCVGAIGLGKSIARGKGMDEARGISL